MTQAQIKPAVPEVTRRAQNLLQLEKDRVETEALINEQKVWFRAHAAGETFKEVVPGMGIVSVNKPSEPKTESGVKPSFLAAKFEELDAATKLILIKAGVVKVESYTTNTPAGTAAVSIKLNV